MNKTTWLTRLPTKIVLFVLTGLFLLATLAGAATVFLQLQYGRPLDLAVREAVTEQLYWQIDGIWFAAAYGNAEQAVDEDAAYSVRIVIDGQTAVDNTTGAVPIAVATQKGMDLQGGETPIEVTLYADRALTGIDDLSAVYRFLTGVAARPHLPWIAAAIGAVMTLTLWSMLLYAAGRTAENGGAPVCRGLARLPGDVYTVLWLAAFLPGCALLYTVSEGRGQIVVTAVLCGAILLALIYLLIALSTNIAVRAKTHTMGNAVTVRALRAAGRGFAALPLIPKTAAVAVLLSAVELPMILTHTADGRLPLLWLAEKTVVLPLLFWFMIRLRQLQTGIRAVADGDLSGRTVDPGRFRGQLRRTAEDIDRLSGSFGRAVEERLKSERLKTELITNVSHDLKTPLTSIVSYVDLLEKEEPENERMREYLAVLHRQSGRLKKLVEDLVEASRASTGDLPVTLAPCRLGVLIEQVLGEYAEKLEAAMLTPVVRQPDEPIDLLADGRHMSRVLDNLMSNICKYGMPGTRVYIDLIRQQGRAAAVFRNTSREPLAADGNELTERFVRGDSARNTEGSGLGLSIAESLTRLQGGQMNVTVDGDLFKVTLSFPAAPEVRP